MSSTASANHDDLLSQFPKLAAWHQSLRAKPPTIETMVELHLWTITKALRTGEPGRVRLWTELVSEVTKNTTAFLEHILETDTLAASLGVSLTDLYSMLAESAIISGQGSKALTALKSLADHTNLAAFRFLSAWAAFNMKMPAECVAECEKVNEPFAPIYTLLGQALLESGQPADAIDALKIAIELAPGDPLPLVQIIKAYLVTGIQIEAMRAVDRCRKILGTHIEIECLAAMSIMAGESRNKDFCERTLAEFERHLTNEPDDVEAYSIAMELAAELLDRDWATRFSRLIDFSAGQNPAHLASKISKILKKTGELQWHELSRMIIDKTLLFTRGAHILTPTQ